MEIANEAKISGINIQRQTGSNKLRYSCYEREVAFSNIGFALGRFPSINKTNKTIQVDMRKTDTPAIVISVLFIEKRTFWKLLCVL